MPFVIFEIPDVAVNYRLIALHDQQVLGILLLCCPGEIEGT